MRARRRYWSAAAGGTSSGTIEFKGAIDFHLADDAQLLISTKREDYHGGLPGSQSRRHHGRGAGRSDYG